VYTGRWKDGSPDNVATTLLGDRAQVDSMAISDGQIDVKRLTFGPDDPMCCPSQQEAQTYAPQGGQRVQISSQTLGTAQP
jgi:hypothetical protein